MFDFTDKPSPIEQFEILGYDSGNFMVLSGSLLINCLIIIGLTLLKFIINTLLTLCAKHKRARRFGVWVGNFNPYPGLIRIYLEGYLELVLCAILAFDQMSASDYESNFSNFLAASIAVVSAFLLGFLPFYVGYILIVHHIDLPSDE